AHQRSRKEGFSGGGPQAGHLPEPLAAVGRLADRQRARWQGEAVGLKRVGPTHNFHPQENNVKLITLNIVVDDAHSEALATHIVRSITDTDLCGIGDYVRRIGAELTDHGVLVT